MVAEENLRFLGFEPDCVSSAEEALARVEDQHILAVVDVGLPDMRGDELTLRLRARSPEMKIIVASGYDPVILRKGFEGDDRVAVISKPYSEDDLARAIGSLGLSQS